MSGSAGRGVPSRGPRRPVAGARPLWPGEGGNAAVEFALVLPILLLILMGIIQFGAVFFIHSNMQHVAQETSRQVAVGAMTAAEAELWAQEQLVDFGGDYGITVEGGGDIAVTIALPFQGLTIADPLGLLPEDRDLRASAVTRRQGT